MISIFKKFFKLVLIFVATLMIYYPSINGFYTNDDFYHLKIAHATNLSQFVDFFNLEKSSGGQLLYRPLTTHVFYFLGWFLFNLNPIGLHIVSFVLLLIIIICVYKIAKLISGDEQISILATFLYATSATHFGHLYYLATELVLGAVFFPTIIFFINYIKSGKIWDYILSIVFFCLALLAKENSVVLVPIFIALYIYFYLIKDKLIKPKSLVISLIPFVAALLAYLYLHFFSYGFVKGDSYIWNLSPLTALNTILWYGAWSLNIPEMFLDFIGPGFKLNPNLLKYWSLEVIPIFVFFIVECVIIAWAFIKSYKNKLLLRYVSYIFWFLITLLPILFLPLHKFTFYLTLPLLGVTLFIAQILKDYKNITKFFCLAWLITTILTLNLTVKTNWITNGEIISRNVYNYVNTNKEILINKTILFYDSSEDVSLPFSPTSTIKNALSDNNFFDVFYNGNIKAVYDGRDHGKNTIKIKSRQFIGY